MAIRDGGWAQADPLALVPVFSADAGRGQTITLTDSDGIIQFWNPGAVRLFGFSSERAIGRSLSIIVPKNLRARHNARHAEAMRTGIIRYGFGDTLARPMPIEDGQRISVESTIMLQHGSGGKISEIAAILCDVTARFQKLRSLRRRAEKLSNA